MYAYTGLFSLFLDTFFYVGTYGAPSGMNGTIVPHYSGAYVI